MGGRLLPTIAVTSAGEPLSDGAKIRSLFVAPDAATRNFFDGVNFESSASLERRSVSRTAGLFAVNRDTGKAFLGFGALAPDGAQRS